MIYMQHGNKKGSATDKDVVGWSKINNGKVIVESNSTYTAGNNKREPGRIDCKLFCIAKTIDAYPSFSVLTTRYNAKLQIKDIATNRTSTFVTTLHDALLEKVITTFSDRCMEELWFSYTKMEHKYTPIDKSGKQGTPIICGYDLRTMQCI